MRQFIRKIGITWLLLLLLVGMSVPVVKAENGNEAIGGSSEKVGYFTVVTEPGAKESYLDFRQTIGVMGQKPNSVAGFFFPNRARMYERYLITAERLENDRVVSTEEYQTELKDFRLNLAPGATYRVKMVPLYIAWVEKMKDPSYARVNGHNNPYMLQLDFFDLDDEHSFLDTVTIDIFRGNWLPTGWVEPALWTIRSSKGVQKMTLSDAWPADPSPSDPGSGADAPIVPAVPETPAPEVPSEPEAPDEGWQTIDGWTYYFLPDGTMATGMTTIGGVTYYFMEHPREGDTFIRDAAYGGFLCKGGFFSRADGSLVFTDDNGAALAWDGFMLESQKDYFEYVFKAYDICYETPDFLSCTYYDLDANGVKEFITCSGSSMAETVYTFYRVDFANDAYVQIGREYGYEDALIRDPKTGKLLIELDHTGYQYVYELTYDGKKVSSREIAVHDSEDGGYRSFGDHVYQYTFTEPMQYPETAEFYPEGPANPPVIGTSTIPGGASEADTATDASSKADASPITEKYNFVTVTLPASWKDRYIVSAPDIGIVQFFNKANCEAGYGGLLFSVYATTRVTTNMQLLDFSIERNFPAKNDGVEVGCRYLDKWENGLVFALYDGTYSFNQNDPALSADYRDMYKDIDAVLDTFRLDAEEVRGYDEYMRDVENARPEWPFYGEIYMDPLY